MLFNGEKIMKIRNTHIILIIVYLSFVALGIPEGAFGVAWPEIRGEMGLSLEWAGLMIMLGSAFYVTISSQMGRLARRVKLWHLSLTGLILMIVGYTIIALSPNFIILVSTFALTGTGMAMLDSSSSSYMAKAFTAREMNWLHCFWGLGAALSPILMTRMILSFNWRWGYISIVAIQGVIAILLLFGLFKGVWKKEERRLSRAEITAQDLNITQNFLTKPWHKFMPILIFFLYGGAEFSTGFWISSLLIDGRQMYVGVAGMFPAVYFGFIMVGRMVFGIWANKYSDATLIRVGFVIAFVGLAILMFSGVNVPLGLSAMAIIGFGFAPFFPCMMHDNSNRFAPDSITKMVGYEMAAFGAGTSILTSLVIGQFMARVHIETLIPIVAIFALSAFLLNETLEKIIKKNM